MSSVQADGFDLDPPSVEMAEQNARAAGVDDRVGESFSTSKNDVDWMMYDGSVLHYLPVGMTDNPPAETGTVMRPDMLRRYARESGFHDVEILPIENYFLRFYRLIQ